MTRARALSALRASVGALLLARPGPLLSVLGGGGPDRAARRYARVLGARHLVEALVTVARPNPRVLWAGALVDGLHAASALALVEGRHHRRLAAFNTAGAIAFTGAGSALARG